MTASPLVPRARDLLRESAEWRLIGLLLECPVEGWLRTVTELAAEVTDPVLRSAVEQARTQASEGLYHSVFGPGGPAPPREVSYCDSVQLGYLLSELEAYYKSFAYEPETPEAADHVAVEAGFIAFLRLKESYAHVTGKLDQASITSEAAARFLRDHLSWIAEPLAAALGESGIGYLESAGRALVERVGPSRPRLPVLSTGEPDGCPDAGPAQQGRLR